MRLVAHCFWQAFAWSITFGFYALCVGWIMWDLCAPVWLQVVLAILVGGLIARTVEIWTYSLSCYRKKRRERN